MNVLTECDSLPEMFINNQMNFFSIKVVEVPQEPNSGYPLVYPWVPLSIVQIIQVKFCVICKKNV